MFNEKATVFLLHLFDFRVSFIKTIQPAGLTASGLSLLPAALWVSPLPTLLPPSPHSRFPSRPTRASWRGEGLHLVQDSPVAPGFVRTPLPSTTSGLTACKSLSNLLPSVVHDPEGSFSPQGFWKAVGQLWGQGV